MPSCMDGMPVALQAGVSARRHLDVLAMSCPSCGGEAVPPLAGSTLTIAWYACGCGHFWSARVRDGRPVPAATELPRLPLPQTR